jgi:putative hydroxymethylpyrimidine transport system substrate-binding protein
MRRIAALLAAALLGTGLAACGGGGAEPGAPKGATLVLDFQPNAVHSGIYAAEAKGYFRGNGLDLKIQEPSSSADSAKLLESGRAEYAVMDINDFGIARERGLNLMAIDAIVQRPLAAVIARDPDQIRTPADLAGKTIGVTGVPSDDAVLDTVLRSGGVDPADVHRVTIGFNAVADLAAGKVDAATAFWNAEGVQLQQRGIPIREFRVDEFGAPRYPELVVATTEKHCSDQAFGSALGRAYNGVLNDDPDEALDALLDSVQGLDADDQRAQLDALTAARAFAYAGAGTDSSAARPPDMLAWLSWAVQNGVIDRSKSHQVGLGFRRLHCSPVSG